MFGGLKEQSARMNQILKPSLWRSAGRTLLAIGMMAGVVGMGVRPASAQASRQPGFSPLTSSPDIGFDQRVNTQVPEDLTFRDEAGKTVQLKDYFTGKKPVLLMMPFFKCPGACTTELNGLMTALKDVKYKMGTDFEVVVVSINPKETTAIAADKKQTYMAMYGKEGAEGAHFLTGPQDAIQKLTKTVGYRYIFNLETEQFAHATGVIVLSPKGMTYRYFSGSDYSPRDLQLAMTEASENKIGSPIDQLLVLCYHYDPTTGHYGLLIDRIIKFFGISTVLILGTSIFIMLRWEKKRNLKAVLPITTVKTI